MLVTRRFAVRRDRVLSRASSELLEQRRMLSTSVSSFHGDAASNGVDLTETVLTAANVNVNTFGKRFSQTVDGQVYAQPLYQPGVSITTGSFPGVHNVVYVATEGDSLYAFDSSSGAMLWRDSFLVAEAGLGAGVTVTTVPNGDVNSGDINPQIGITSTPAIDTSTGYLFLTAKTKQVVGTAPPRYVYTLEKVNIASGAFTSTVIGDTTYNASNSTYIYNSGPYVFDPHGAGAGEVSASINGSVSKVVYFNALRQMNRAGITIYNGNVYIAFASHGDTQPYHGWILGYSESTLAATAALNLNPDGSDAGIWQSGGKIAIDPAGNMYVETGNGTFDTTLVGGFPQYGDYGTSFVKFTVDPTTSATNQNINGWGLKVVDYFTPHDQASLSQGDLDLGSGGPIVLPATLGSVTLGGASDPNLLLGSGKSGTIYLINRDNMGHYSSTTDNVAQVFVHGVGGSGSFDTPALFYDGTSAYLIYSGTGTNAQEYTVANGAISSIASTSSASIGSFGPSPMVSANGTSNGIAWLIDNGNGKLRAYQADNLTKEYYDSGLNSSRDSLGAGTKFSSAAVADGQVFAGTSNALVVYALIATPVALSGPVNYIRLDANGSSMDVYNNSTGTGTPVQYIPSSVTVTGSASASSLIVDFSAGDPLPASGLNYNGGSGGGALTVLGTSGNDLLSVTPGVATFNTIALNYSHLSGITFNGGAGSDQLIQAAGTPPLTFAGTTLSDTLTVNGGTYTFAAPAAGAGDVPLPLGTLTIASGAFATLNTEPTGSARTMLQLTTLSIAGTSGSWLGTLDLGGNDLAISTGSVGQLNNQIAQGYNGGAWNGNGIISAAAAHNPTHLTTLGVTPSPANASSGAIVSYTYYGDATVDGKVDASDYSRIDSGYLAASTGWNNGDFNYDSIIDGSDYTLIDNAFNTQGATLLATIASPAATPATALDAVAGRSAFATFADQPLSFTNPEPVYTGADRAFFGDDLSARRLGRSHRSM